MPDLNQLEQLIAIYEHKTLSKAAEELHISQPALTRSIQRLENEMEVVLFDRNKNRLSLNEDGLLAVEYAKRILDLNKEMKETLQAAVQSRKTISIASIAPAPLWALTSEIQRHFPQMSVVSQIVDREHIHQGLADDTYQLIITDEASTDDLTESMDYCEEDLYASLTPNHPFATKKEISFNELNGQSILLYSEVGFWSELCHTKMPNSLFIVQNEFNALNEVRRRSELIAFATNLTEDNHQSEIENRILIPISDEEANVIFYLKYKKANRRMFQNIPPLA